MTMTAKLRAALRAECNTLQATVHVGKDGLTQAVMQSLDDALRTRELVKIQFSKNADVDAKASANRAELRDGEATRGRATIASLANEVAASVGADVVQTIGRTATLYRENPDLHE